MLLPKSGALARGTSDGAAKRLLRLAFEHLQAQQELGDFNRLSVDIHTTVQYHGPAVPASPQSHAGMLYRL